MLTSNSLESTFGTAIISLPLTVYKNKGCLQQLIFNHRSGYFDSYLRQERTDLRSLITKQDSSIISNQNVKERTLFDDFKNNAILSHQ